MSLKYNPQGTTNMPTAGRLRPSSAASMSAEKREDQHHAARVCGELAGTGQASVPRHMFLKEKICLRILIMPVLVHFDPWWLEIKSDLWCC